MDSKLYKERVTYRIIIPIILFFLFGLPVNAQTEKEWRDSLSRLNKAIERCPKNIDLRLKKAAVNVELKQWDYALEEYSKVLEVDNNITARFFRAYINYNLRRYDMASLDYEEILSAFPKHFEARLGLAMTKKKQGNKQDAMDQLNLLVQLYPDSAIAYAARAGYETELKQYDVALFDWDEAIRLEPQNAEYVVSKVDILLTLKRKKDAKKTIQDAQSRGIPKEKLSEWILRTYE